MPADAMPAEAMPAGAPSIADIAAAARRLAGAAVRTPLLDAPLLDDRLGCRLVLKAEPLQLTGSFKFRGAYNRISLIPQDRRGAGVIAYSSGNHAQGVAAAARLHGVRATVVMPADAPAIKRRNTEAWGAAVVPYDRAAGESREAVAAEIVARTGATLVRPYDDPAIVAGQGTVGLEIAEQLAERGLAADAVLVPCGGGGLSAGVAIALAARMPAARVHPVEPAGFDDTGRSLAAGERVANAPGGHSICDALLAPTPGEFTFPVNRRLLAPGLAVDDDRVRAAMAAAFDYFKLVVEPGGAVALAAALAGAAEFRGRTVVAVASGGNADPSVFRTALCDRCPAVA
jgi:threonine dehydratase